MRVSIYTRTKNEQGRWRYQRVKQGRGHKTGDLTGPFFLRYATPDGKQTYSLAEGVHSLDGAAQAAESLKTALLAQSKGLTVAELDDLTNINRVPIKNAVAQFLELKKGKARKTVLAYTHALDGFVESLPAKVRFMDQLAGASGAEVLRAYKGQMAAKGFAGKTQHDRLNIVFFLLKKNGIKNPLGWDEMPTVEEEPAVAYTEEELKKLFAAMDDEEEIRYKFFLGTACRDKEVTFAAWKDIDFNRKTYTVRRKEDVGFTPKSHESRTIPLPASVVAMLKERERKAPHPRWIFVNEEGRPDNHFLRKLKRIAKRAGLNCGHCRTSVTKGKYHLKKQVEVTCATDPVCEHFYLHRFRKTTATRWLENGISIKTIQGWLGHKSLETTDRYLGVTNVEKLRGQIDAAFGD